MPRHWRQDTFRIYGIWLHIGVKSCSPGFISNTILRLPSDEHSNTVHFSGKSMRSDVINIVNCDDYPRSDCHVDQMFQHNALQDHESTIFRHSASTSLSSTSSIVARVFALIALS